MNGWCKTAIMMDIAVLLLAAGCGQRQELSGPRVKQQDTNPPR